jgi:hypothetical protein
MSNVGLGQDFARIHHKGAPVALATSAQHLESARTIAAKALADKMAASAPTLPHLALRGGALGHGPNSAISYKLATINC